MCACCFGGYSLPFAGMLLRNCDYNYNYPVYTNMMMTSGNKHICVSITLTVVLCVCVSHNVCVSAHICNTTVFTVLCSHEFF